MKNFLFTLILGMTVTSIPAQTLECMQWFNEPENWKIEDGRVTMEVTPHSDYWRISHYGFTVDDAPFLYTLRGGEFEVKVKISGEYKVRFDQAGLMLRIDKENYIRTAIIRTFNKRKLIDDFKRIIFNLCIINQFHYGRTFFCFMKILNFNTVL